MDLRLTFFVMLTLTLASLATWAGCRWWYGKKLLVAAQRLHKSDQGRLFSQQQTAQAKKQIEALKKELDEQRKALQDAEIGRKRTRDLEHALAATGQVTQDNSRMRPLKPGHGFADTQIVP